METNIRPRAVSLDRLKSLVVLLVVVMHSNVTYSGMGQWYYTETDSSTLDLVSKLLFGLYGSFTQAWFLGALFFASAYLSAGSLSRKGPGKFFADRLVRLGIPLALYVFLLHPLTVTLAGRPFDYAVYLGTGRFLSGTGPLWFVFVLLMLDGILALAARWRGLRSNPRALKVLDLFAAAGVIAALAFCLRLFWPLGSSVFNLQFGYFASYLVLYWLGTRCWEQGWFEQLGAWSPRLLWISLGAALVTWGPLLVAAGALEGAPAIDGGFRWEVALYAVWESAVAVFVGLGILGALQRGGPAPVWEQWVHRQSFRIYLVHAPVLVALSVLMQNLDWAPLAKHALVAPLACAASLGVAALLNLPGLRRIAN